MAGFDLFRILFGRTWIPGEDGIINMKCLGNKLWGEQFFEDPPEIDKKGQ